MKRRMFGLMSTCAAAALGAGATAVRSAKAAAGGAAQAALLKTTLTPMGAEKAGNSDGSIPPWTGGLTTLPEGWSPGEAMPDMFAADHKLLSIDASNAEQYKDRLTDGLIALIQKNSHFRIDIYPTHRTAAAPQWVYDYIYLNALNAQPVSGGSRLGFTNAYGGVPFPIPDPTDPLEAGAQIMWNHNCAWQGQYQTVNQATCVVINGQFSVASGFTYYQDAPYYMQGGSAESFDGWIRRISIRFTAPANLAGEAIMEWLPTNPLIKPTQLWQYLTGQGRVRKAPELTYDTPQGYCADETNYDENDLFNGALDRYDWKLIGKKELYIPYNNNKLSLGEMTDVVQPNCLDPDYIRWELHRVWVVDATLHPGQRHVVPHRRFYVDEDTWQVVVCDEWDAQGNLWKVGMMFEQTRPDIPGTIYASAALYNLQTGDYILSNAGWSTAPWNKRLVTTPIPGDIFNPQSMAAQDQY
jgi:hypothetical protein